MDHNRFDALISRLEATAQASPRRYLAAVLAVVLLGFGVLGVAVLFALVPAAALIGLVGLVIVTGGKALIVLFKLGKLLVLLAIPAWLITKASVQLLFSRFPRPQGRELTQEEAPALFARIEALRQRTGGPRIHHVLLTDELNAAIVQHPRLGLFGGEENYLILGLRLLQTLGEEEALAVVAHEYGHLCGHHSRLGGFIYRMRSAWGRMQAMSEQWTDWGSRLIARLFRWYAPYFNAYTFVLARQQEYAADRLSTELVGAQTAGHALMRTRIAAQFEHEQFWPAIGRMVAGQPEPLADRSRFWVQSVSTQLDEPTRWRYLDTARQQRTDHLDTHPALGDRLKAMGIAADEAAAQTLVPPGHNAATLWLADALPAIEADFDTQWQQAAAESWQARHRHLVECRETLAALQAKEELSVEDRWQRITLLDEVSPEQDRLPELNELLAISPDHASALLHRGTLLLSRGDEAGVADLERLMVRDPQSTRPACEAAWQFYRERSPERAEHYRDRWLARADYEERVHAEFQTLPADATIAEHGLDEATQARIRELLQTHGDYIERAFLLRRILKTDASLHDFVLAFETSRFTLGDKSAEVVERLAKQEFPVSTFVVPLRATAHRQLRRQIRRMKLAPFFAR